MIKAVLVINTSGKVRLSQFYQNLPSNMKAQIAAQVYSECTKRGDSSCNFIENLGIWGDFRFIYRLYATLYIIFVVDSAQNELGILDLIQVFVEVLDKAFENVCELDLVFHVERAYAVLEEIVMGGMVFETNIGEIWKVADALFKQENRS